MKNYMLAFFVWYMKLLSEHFSTFSKYFAYEYKKPENYFLLSYSLFTDSGPFLITTRIFIIQPLNGMRYIFRHSFSKKKKIINNFLWHKYNLKSAQIWHDHHLYDTKIYMFHTLKIQELNTKIFLEICTK